MRLILAIRDAIWWAIMAVMFVVFIGAVLYGVYSFLILDVAGVWRAFGVIMLVMLGLVLTKPGRGIW